MNSNTFHFTFCLFIFLVASCPGSAKPDPETPPVPPELHQELDFDALANLLFERMDLQAGEQVLLVGKPGRFDPLISELSNRLSNSSAGYLGAISVSDQQPDDWTTQFVIQSAGLDTEQLQDYLKQVDIGVMLPGATPDDLVYALIQKNLHDGKGRTIHFHWAGAYDFNGQLLEVTANIDHFYQDALLSTDYLKLAELQKLFEQAMRGKTISVTTPSGTDISFVIGNRPVTKQSGDASAATASLGRNLIDREMELPAGAIRVAPVETSVNGQIAFPDALWNNIMVTGLVLSFEQGKVTDMMADGGIEGVRQVMEEAGESARSFREFALGLNPELAIPDVNPWIPYYGYGAGVVRLSLGDNTELGGHVSGGFVRWNFFPDATVKVGQDVWVDGGKFVKMSADQ